MVYTVLREGNDEESLTYTFVLSPVIPRTIVSRTVEDGQPPRPNGVVVQLVSRETVQCDQFVKWAIVSGPSAHFELRHNNTLLAFAHGGLYSISLHVEHCAMRHDAVFELFVNYRRVQSLHWSVGERESITSLLEVQPNDVLGVSYRGRSVIPPVGLQVKVQIRHDLLTLWLEDRQTTRQWQTAELKLEDFVSSGNFIAQTHMAGYARPIGEQTQAEFWTRRQYDAAQPFRCLAPYAQRPLPSVEASPLQRQ
ncbi:hypothetical protein Poli38472_013605 [Pythium oligandrum]|uniref:Uncharacterized protein n=1 Tax=Pythium oligandrum TaxID=41045 RepID=A0A8K1FIV4_PYTOL|nr:hypothetical protein Poli38472_013605 [Pythium oligandrum]|eukprot:TMW61142.1 hypothetical protein Poli38472_013605 [Pythium oligandrum]